MIYEETTYQHISAGKHATDYFDLWFVCISVSMSELGFGCFAKVLIAALLLLCYVYFCEFYKIIN